MKINRDENGFTLIELIIVLAITSLLVFSLTMGFSNSNRVFNFNNENLIIQQDHRLIVKQIGPFIRMSNVPPVINTGTYTSVEDRVRLRFSTVDASTDYNGIGFGIDNNNRLYYRRRRETSPGNFEWGNRVAFIDSQVNSFEVNPDAANEMITITVELEDTDSDTSYTFIDTFYRRIQG